MNSSNTIPFRSNLFLANDMEIEKKNIIIEVDDICNSNNLFLNVIEDIPIDNKEINKKIIELKTSKYNDCKKLNFGMKPSLYIEELKKKLLLKNHSKKEIYDIKEKINELIQNDDNLKVIKSRKAKRFIKISTNKMNSFCDLCNIKFNSKECKGSHKAKFHPTKRSKADIKLNKFLKKECSN